MKNIEIGMVFLIILFWGLWAFFGKLASNKIGIQLAFWSFVISAVVMVSFLAFAGKLAPLQTNKTGIMFALLSGISITVGSIIFYILLEKQPAGILIAATSIYPVVTILLSFLFLKEPITTNKLIGIILAVGGLVFLSL